MKASAVLRKAKERISAPGAWTKGEMARDIRGFYVRPQNPAATSWCIAGACNAETSVSQEYYEALGYLEKEVPGDRAIGIFNDRQDTVGPVLELFDRAIALAEAGGR